MKHYEIDEFAKYLNEYKSQHPEDDCLDVIQSACEVNGWTYIEDEEGYYEDDFASDGQYILCADEYGNFTFRYEEGCFD